MKRFSFVLILLPLLVAANSFAQQTVTWTGVSDGFDFTNPGNWDVVPTNSDTLLGIVDVANLADDFIINNGSTVDFFVPTGMGGATNVWSLSVDSNSSLRLTDGSGTFYGMRAAVLNIDNGSFVSTQFMANGVTATIGSGSSLFLNGAGNPINQSTIDLAGDLTGTIISFETVANFSSEHLSKITVNGSPASLIGGNIMLTSDSSMDYTGDGVPDTVTIAQGLAGNPFLFADLDGDGDIDSADWATFRGNLFGDLTPPVDPLNPTTAELASAYSMGDLDNDFDVDLNDFGLFDDAYDAENGTGAFAAMVPEPTPGVYAGILLLAGLALRRRVGMRFTSKLLLPCLLAMTVLMVARPSHADITYTGLGLDPNDIFAEDNYDLTGSPLFDPGNPTADIIVEATQGELTAGTVVAVGDNITIANANLTSVVTKGFGSLSIGAGFTTTLDGLTLTTSTNGGFSGNNTVAAGGSGSGHPCLTTTNINVINGSAINTQFIVGAVMTVDGTSSVTFRGGGNPVNDGLGGVGLILEQNAQVTFPGANNFGSAGTAGEAPNIWAANASGELVRYLDDPSILTLDAAGTTATAVNVNTLGARCPIGIVVDQGTGEITLDNPNTTASFTSVLDAYTINSAGGSLTSAGWNSLQDQNLAAFPAGNGTGNGWEEGGMVDAFTLGETYLTNTSTLAAATSISLGSAYDTSVDAADLVFRFRDASGNLNIGTVTYLPATGGVACDADADGDCINDDIVAMYAAAGTAGPFDFDGNGTIGPEDIPGWLAAASTSDNTANPTGRVHALGDLNLDFEVNSIDLGLLLNNFNSTAATPGAGVGWQGGDADMDGNVNSIDLGLVLNNFNFVGNAASTQAVPEPSSALLVLLSVGCFCITRRKRN